ncbi:MAG: glutamyl-tRNA reductase [Cyanobacteria bacterium]|nr:glutamyl-tRNA reductase [Cyanobacteria bacterium CG_2015-16_32_12]NCO79513.1 glutamyl-tRNA reductase [Cyanobacteria bacterium CG_2015-22_32_23]NCQ40472.1 glutamyl-tRNA reductase [Cyanobacteria bacterium CG_2015-04_32_10]NCS84557.1 glutamyl-tRNA reductase [Cyanobacteria bacterium CG_2015-02_32_10]
MNIIVVGLSHKTAAVEVREKLSIPENKIEESIHHLLTYPHVEEVGIMSTCNRLEIYAVVKETEQGVTEISQFLSEIGHIPLQQLRKHLFILLHQDAIRHLMRVSAGLESLVLGEGQILAQVRNTHKLATKYQGMSRLLDRLFKQAISAGKRVRTETNIGTGAVSISSAAVELVDTKIEDLCSQKVCIIGAGKMSRLLVQHLASKGVSNIAIVNRSVSRSQELAKQFPQVNLQLHSLEEMMMVVSQSDIVFTSTGATQPILHKTNLCPLEVSQCIMLVDISVPRNVSSDVTELDFIVSYNVDDLKAVVAQNQASRREMAREAEVLLEEEIETFELWWQSLETVPTISCLRSKIEEIREQELEKALSRLGSEFAEKHQEVIEALTRGIVNKILHDPMVQLRAQQDIEARRKALQTLQTLFNLEITEQFG